MKKFKLLSYLLIGLSSVALVAAGFTFAWFSGATKEVDINSLRGGVISEYFHPDLGSDGSEQHPYVITKPVHLYNLVELYQNLDGFAAAGHHFQLGYDFNNDGYCEVYNYNDNGIYQGTDAVPSYSTSLNMGYYDTGIKPIGDETHAFIGTFDGSGLEISNLTIKGNNNSDLGFFGYVTADATVKDLYLDNLTIDATSAEKGHHNHTVLEKEADRRDRSFVGYIAGHIEDATCFENVYVNNCTIEGSNSNIANDWGYFGYCSNAATLDVFIEKAKNGGQGNDWGGSIDMKSLNVRLYNHLNDRTKTSYSTNGYYGKYESTYSDISVVRGDKASTYYTRNPLTTQTFYNLMGNGNHTYKENYTLPGTYIPLLENDDGTVPTKNTGYIVSDSESMSSANGTVRSASYQMRYIANSLVGTKASDKDVYSGTGSAASVSFNANNLEILTNKGTTYSTSNYYLIKDEYNKNHSVSNAAISSFTKSDATTPESLGFEKYNDSREALDSVLQGESFIHGIHFMGTAISTSKTIQIPTAIVDGTTKTSYIVPKSCIDFRLKDTGYINFFGGSYYARTSSTGSYADSFFSLNYITRNAQDGISSIKQINNIYLNTNTAEGQPKYVYGFSDNTYSTGTRGTLVFNMNFIMNEPPAHNALYYFEIPVNAGEYALGTVSGKTGGGYLMYLDIQAAGTTPTETVVDDFGSVEYRSMGDDFSEPLHSTLIITYDYSNTINFSLEVIYNDTEKKYYINFTRNTTVYITILNIENYYYEINGSPFSPPAIDTYEYAATS